MEVSSGNVYADLGMPDADELIVKAHLVDKIGEAIKGRQLSEQQAAKVLGFPTPFCSYNKAFLNNFGAYYPFPHESLRSPIHSRNETPICTHIQMGVLFRLNWR